MAERKKVKVKIFDRELSLITEDEDLTLEVAKYLNTVMEEIKTELSDQPTQVIAILAALNIASDLFLERNKNKDLLIQATERIKKLKLHINQTKVPNPTS